MTAWRTSAVVAAALLLALTATAYAKPVKKTLKGYQQVTTSRDCLTPDTRSLLQEAESHFGVTFEIVSTCRVGAVIAGSGRPSLHRYGRAVDFKVSHKISKREVVKWLYARTRGVVMTYRSMAHIHFDTGPYHKLARANY